MNTSSFFLFNFPLQPKPQFRIKRKKSPETARKVPEKISSERKKLVDMLNLGKDFGGRSLLNNRAEIIEKRFNRSKVNNRYVFPREELDDNVSRSSSIQSMDGTLVYKLSSQNRKKNKRVHTEIGPQLRISSRLLLKQKVQWTNRKKYVTQRGDSNQKEKALSSARNQHSSIIITNSQISKLRSISIKPSSRRSRVSDTMLMSVLRSSVGNR